MTNNHISDYLEGRRVEKAEEPKPQFFDLSKEEDQKRLAEILAKNPHVKTVDTYEQQLLETFVLDNPWLHINRPQRDKEFVEFKAQHFAEENPWENGKWVYLPWRNIVLHVLEDAEYQKVRTGRNRNIIRPEEQEKFYNATIGIAGQSVGNSCTLAIVLTGGGKNLRLADPDTLELTNLNRIRGTIADLTDPKVYMTARQVYELDPYANIELFTDGITEENIEKFFDGPPKLDVIIDEIDQLGLKIRIRQEAKKRGIPVVMAADNGESGVLEIERYDLDPETKPFHGRARGDIAERVLGKDLPLPLIGRIIGEELIGFDIHEERMLESLLELGKSVPTWPQLGTAAMLNGVLVAAATRWIVNGRRLINGQVNASLLPWLDPMYEEPEEVERRSKAINEFVEKDNEKLKQILGE